MFRQEGHKEQKRYSLGALKLGVKPTFSFFKILN
jgi:hypothetical protein